MYGLELVEGVNKLTRGFLGSKRAPATDLVYLTLTKDRREHARNIKRLTHIPHAKDQRVYLFVS